MRNKSILDKPVGGTSADIADAIAKKHTQGTDTTLGTMTANIDLNGYQITNQVIHTVADGTARLALTAVAGKLVFQADTARLYIYG